MDNNIKEEFLVKNLSKKDHEEIRKNTNSKRCHLLVI